MVAQKHKCLISRLWATLIVPPVCNGGPLCKGSSKVCCLESRCALPCDAEVPCTVGCCFLVCWQNGKLEISCNQTQAPAAQPVSAAQVTVTSTKGAPDVAEMLR